MLVWFWILGVLAVYLAALSNVFLAARSQMSSSEIVSGQAIRGQVVRGQIVRGQAVRGQVARGLKSRPIGGSIYLELRAALSALIALSSSLVSLSLISSPLFSGLSASVSPAARPASHPLGWVVLGLFAWLVSILVFAVSVPLRFAPVLGAEGPARVLTGITVRFFVLPIGRVAARIARKAAGPAASGLEEGSGRELYAIFSRDPSEALRSEPLASVVKEFTRTTAEDIMVPRSAIVAVPGSSTLAECVDVFATKRFSRLPVYDGDVESVIGIVHVMDLLKESDLTKSVSQIVRPVPMVPESKRCDELLKEFQKSHGYMAIVLDEYGGTAGLVTVEDLLEELVGEMGHEQVWAKRSVHHTADGSFSVHAQIEVEKFESATEIKLPRGEYETLAGYLLQEFGRIPEVGASVLRGGVLYEVTEANSRRIKLVRVSMANGKTPERHPSWQSARQKQS